MQYKFNRVCVMGLGYIGLPTAALLASRGIETVGVDINEERVATVNAGGVSFHEPGLDAVVKTAVGSGKLQARTTPIEADVFLIAVPTPVRDDHAPDMAAVHAAAKAIAPVLKAGDLVVLESTSPVGTTEIVAGLIAAARTDLSVAGAAGRKGETEIDVHIAYCPERILPGRALTELVENDRIIGGLSRECRLRARAFYRQFVQGDCRITTARVAEMCKLTENAFRDVNIAFANELSILADRLDVDVWELIELSNLHPRVNVLQPGPGVGGHCIAVDPWLLVHSAPDITPLIQTARQVNDSKPDFVIEKVRAVAERFKAPKIACLGLAFKPDIDDLRESPALDIATELASAGFGEFIINEPHIKALPADLAAHAGVRFERDAEAAIDAADIVLLLVDHRLYKDIEMTLLEQKIVIDTRGLWARRRA